jgi:hypothetical protein
MEAVYRSCFLFIYAARVESAEYPPEHFDSFTRVARNNAHSCAPYYPRLAGYGEIYDYETHSRK